MAPMTRAMYESKFKAELLRRFVANRLGRPLRHDERTMHPMVTMAMGFNLDEQVVDAWIASQSPGTRKKNIRTKSMVATSQDQDEENEEAGENEEDDEDQDDEGTRDNEDYEEVPRDQNNDPTGFIEFGESHSLLNANNEQNNEPDPTVTEQDSLDRAEEPRDSLLASLRIPQPMEGLNEEPTLEEAGRHLLIDDGVKLSDIENWAPGTNPPGSGGGPAHFPSK
jgi:hypothetical protein